MHERDLRRVALESGKTMSRKAKAKQLSARSSLAGSARNSAQNSPAPSPMHSPTGSRAGSRVGSRHGSEDEDSDDSDELASSVASLDIGSRAEEFLTASPDQWQPELAECIDQIIERTRNKRNTGEAREEMLAVYTSIVRAQYAADDVTPRVDELLPALVKCFRSGSGEREAVFALQALTVTILTTGEPAYHELSQPLKSRISDTSSDLAQATAVQALGILTFFGGADYNDTEETMEYLLSIIDSDGESVNAADSVAVVAAALQQWGFLATKMPKLEGRSETPITSFEEQLDSSNVGVQIAAGENIALLYEQSFSPRGDDEEPDPIPVEEEDEFEIGIARRNKWIHRYDPYNHQDEFALKGKLTQLSRMSARHISKDKRKDMHKAFTDVLHTLEHPWRGPRFSTALDKDAQYYMGHRLAVKDGRDASVTINRWWKYHRFEVLKRALGSGFTMHYKNNEVVRDALPGGLEAPEDF